MTQKALVKELVDIKEYTVFLLSVLRQECGSYECELCNDLVKDITKLINKVQKQ